MEDPDNFSDESAEAEQPAEETEPSTEAEQPAEGDVPEPSDTDTQEPSLAPLDDVPEAPDAETPPEAPSSAESGPAPAISKETFVHIKLLMKRVSTPRLDEEVAKALALSPDIPNDEERTFPEWEVAIGEAFQ